jgi:hypothetical protein
MCRNLGTGTSKSRIGEHNPFSGPLPPSWEWKVVDGAVVAKQSITDFVAEGYDPRDFYSSKRQNHAFRTLQAFVDRIPSRSASTLLPAIEKDIKGMFPDLKRHVGQLGSQPNDKEVRDAFKEYLEAIAIWIACMEHLEKVHGKDKEETDRLNHMHKLKVDLLDSFRLAVSAVVKSVRLDRQMFYCNQLVKAITNWLEPRKKPKQVRFDDCVVYITR